MIDFHSHVLPALDDGAKDVQESKLMLDMAAAQGTTTVVLTPHYYGKRRSPLQFLQLRQKAYERLTAVAPEGMRLVLGAEVHFPEDGIVSFEDMCSLAIGNTKYVLVEFPFWLAWRKDPLVRLHDFIAETGYTPVIAHVERYAEFLRNPQRLTEFVEAGCLLQVNTEAFLSKETKGLAFAMLNKGLVHCIGTDMHDTVIRKPDYDLAKTAIEAENAEAFAGVQNVMKRILSGEYVKPFGGEIKRFMGKYY